MLWRLYVIVRYMVNYIPLRHSSFLCSSDAYMRRARSCAILIGHTIIVVVGLVADIIVCLDAQSGWSAFHLEVSSMTWTCFGAGCHILLGCVVIGLISVRLSSVAGRTSQERAPCRKVILVIVESQILSTLAIAVVIALFASKVSTVQHFCIVPSCF